MVYNALIKNKIEKKKKNGLGNWGRGIFTLCKVKDVQVLRSFYSHYFSKCFNQTAENFGWLVCFKQEEHHHTGLSLPDLSSKLYYPSLWWDGGETQITWDDTGTGERSKGCWTEGAPALSFHTLRKTTQLPFPLLWLTQSISTSSKANSRSSNTWTKKKIIKSLLDKVQYPPPAF